eukprot:TRINITY_DN7414_c0_g2_i3.p1 TRINITY_DN7414_c0_g2~~TRINITY_DN7414_c0_g2_i3.p1  ORF type:complete len:292 (-),score=12.15 TRINITY_DN7414_c0_g2_i3:11-886(-)
MCIRDRTELVLSTQRTNRRPRFHLANHSIEPLSPMTKHNDHLILGNKCDEETIEKYKAHIQHCMEQISFLRLESKKKFARKIESKFLLGEPPYRKTHTLVLDLEGTLIARVNSARKGDISLLISSPETGRFNYHFRLRPFIFDFLEALGDRFELIVFSSESPEITNAVVNKIDPGKRHFNACLTSRECISMKMEARTLLVKDLRIFGNRRPSNLIVVDDNPAHYPMHLEYVFPILPWEGDPGDDQLLHLKDYLLSLLKHKDYRYYHWKFLPPGLQKLSSRTLNEKEDTPQV